MQADDHCPDHDGSEDGRSGIGEDESEDRGHGEHAEDGPVGDRAAAEDDRPVAGEAEEEPGGGEGDEGEQGGRVPEEGDGEDGEAEEGVVGAEVGYVMAEAEASVAGAGGASEGGDVEKLQPRALGGDQGPAVLLKAGDQVGGPGGGRGRVRRRGGRRRVSLRDGRPRWGHGRWIGVGGDGNVGGRRCIVHLGSSSNHGFLLLPPRWREREGRCRKNPERVADDK